MSQVFTCPQGHQWEKDPEPQTATLGLNEALRCPVCGIALQAVTQDLPAEPEAAASPKTIPYAALRTARDTPGQPREIAGYEILEVLGRGGMAVVYKARQRSLDRLVALKMMLSGAYAGPLERARFRAEAEVVACLQHANIVQIYEVGEQEGCPYLCLEFVDGGSLDQHLAGKPLPAAAAAELGETLARAVAFAHQRGIIHRDLKPGNVLLASGGRWASGGCKPPEVAIRSGGPGGSHPPLAQFTVKIGDFGLAKRLELTMHQTQTGQILGTPCYMAPEQAEGRKDIGPATDTYALGAILYELLTGQPPFGGLTSMETLRQVLSRDPVPPTRLQPKIPRDLETICLKCLAHEPHKRYASADALADDLHRFRTGRPIEARPVGKGERALKWARRRPAAAALVAVSALAALSLLVVILWSYVELKKERDAAEVQRGRADASFQKAMQAMDELTEAEVELPPEPQLDQKRRARLDRALVFYTEFLQERGDDPAVRREIALAYKHVADIARLLGQPDRARAAYDQAITLLRQLATDSPAEPVLRQYLADSYTYLGETLRAIPRPADALDAYREALALQQRLVAEEPNEPAYRNGLARSHYNIGIVLKDVDRPHEAEAALGAAIDQFAALVQEFPDEPLYQQGLARSYLNFGPVLRAAGWYDEAEEAYDRAIALLQKLIAKYPRRPATHEYHHELGVSYNNLGNLLGSTGRFGGAKAAHGQARDLFARLVLDYPRVPIYRKELANTYNSLGAVFARGKEPNEAESAWRQAAEEFRGLVQEFPETADYQGGLGMALGNLGWLLRRQAPAKARSYLEAAREPLQAAVRANPKNISYLQALSGQYRDLAESLLQLGQHAEAAQAAAALPRVFQDRGPDYYLAARFLSRCVAAAAKDSRLGDAQRDALVQDYGSQALDLLAKAVRLGAPEVRGLTRERDFDPLRDRANLQGRLSEIEVRVRSELR
jgi:serine/threonine protein kinase/tetratricopeptide (TPR) repeat protein